MTIQQAPAKPQASATFLYRLEESCTGGVVLLGRRLAARDLFLDVMQQRSKQYEEHAAKPAPHVLEFGAELVMDGRKLPRPVNYILARVTPPKGVSVNAQEAAVRHRRPARRPRTGHRRVQGAERNRRGLPGRPSLLLHRLPSRAGPRPDYRGHCDGRGGVSRARHRPSSRGRWQAGSHRQLPGRLGGDDGRRQAARAFGPIIVAGSPLSYWAGVHGENPMRYTGGLLGGTWLTALMGDLGAGKFDGAWLVSNFENLNPANTLLDQAVQSLFQGRYRSSPLSRIREMVGRARPSQRRGDAVHRRRAVHRQQARDRQAS